MTAGGREIAGSVTEGAAGSGGVVGGSVNAGGTGGGGDTAANSGVVSDDGAGVSEIPSAFGFGTFNVAPARSVLGLPLTKASGLPATRIAIICGAVIVGEDRTRRAIAARVSPGFTGP